METISCCPLRFVSQDSMALLARSIDSKVDQLSTNEKMDAVLNEYQFVVGQSASGLSADYFIRSGNGKAKRLYILVDLLFESIFTIV